MIVAKEREKGNVSKAKSGFKSAVLNSFVEIEQSDARTSNKVCLFIHSPFSFNLYFWFWFTSVGIVQLMCNNDVQGLICCTQGKLHKTNEIRDSVCIPMTYCTCPCCCGVVPGALTLVCLCVCTRFSVLP